MCKIADNIGPFQNFSAFDHLVCSDLKELQIFERIVFNLMEKLDLICNLDLLLNTDFIWFLMVMPSLVMEGVPLNCTFGILHDFHLILILFVGHYFLFLTTCMSTLSSHTYPAELVFALFTAHTVASLVFLNCCFALWTHFRVSFNPSDCIFVSTFFFFNPFFNMTASGRLMLLFLTIKAISLSTSTGDWSCQSELIFLYDP